MTLLSLLCRRCVGIVAAQKLPSSGRKLPLALCSRPRQGRQNSFFSQAVCSVQSAAQSPSNAGEGHSTVPQLSARSFDLLVEQDLPSGKAERLDSFLADAVPTLSRAKAAAAVKGGFVTIDGQTQTKSAFRLRVGQRVLCNLPPPRPVAAEPQDLPLDIAFEDEYLMVINKPAGMVVHPAPGHLTSGTLVNALLHHWRRPAIVADIDSSDGDESDNDEAGSDAEWSTSSQSLQALRPGIVHRLDKGTTGLMVVAKDDVTLAHLSNQFKERTVQRQYISILVGCPTKDGTIATNIGRHQRDRKLMTAYAYGSARGRQATSTVTVLSALAEGRAALAAWKLGSGRTHQIRVHAKHVGHPLFGDEAYGGSGPAIARRVAGQSSMRQATVLGLLSDLQRPALHAQQLGFEHPHTHQQLSFAAEIPSDFAVVLQMLQELV